MLGSWYEQETFFLGNSQKTWKDQGKIYLLIITGICLMHSIESDGMISCVNAVRYVVPNIQLSLYAPEVASFSWLAKAVKKDFTASFTLYSTQMVILIEISHFSSPAHSSIVIPNPSPIFRGGISTRMWPSSMSPIAFNHFFSSFNCNLDLVTRKTQAFYVLLLPWLLWICLFV